jgi:spermidine synthase
MPKSFIFSLFILGFTSLISQVIFLRELMVSFYGNEFFLGLVLAVWLGWVAMGSFWLVKLLKKIKDPLRILLSCHILVVLLLPLLILLIRLAKSWTPVVGQIPDLLPSLILAILTPAPLCLILGLQFTITTRCLNQPAPASFRKKDVGQAAQSVNRAYFIESIGFVLAGLFFSFFLISFNTWIAVSILAFLNSLTVLAILFSLPKRKYSLFKIISLLLLFIFALLSLPQLNQFLDYQTQNWRFPKQKLIKLTNSAYGQLTVSQSLQNKQYNFYQNGLWLGSSQEIPFNESLAHFSLLFHHQPQNILLIGHGFDGLIKEILKHQPQQVYYLELDPWLIKTIWPYLPDHLQKTLRDQKVKIIHQDGRHFFKKLTPEKFDLVLINLPDPSTALLNRFYAQECFEEIKNQLQESGILATYLSFSPNYQNEDLIKLEASIYQTLKSVFPEIIILPEEGTVTLLAVNSKDTLTASSELLIQRWQQRNLQTKFINPQYLDYILTNERTTSLKRALTEEKVKINRDTWPISYVYNFLLWTNYFHPNLADFLRLSLKIDFKWLLVLFFLLLILILFLRKRIKQDKILWSAMAVAGFSLMTIEIILIFAYQSFFGYLYYRLALLIALFMFGLAAGTWLGIKKSRQKTISFSPIIQIHFFILIYALLIYFFFWSNLFNQISLFLGREIVFPLLAILIGALVGLEFTYINQLYLDKKNKPSQKGFIYSADLVGSCLGASLTALFLIPLLGIAQTLLILIIVNLLIIILLQISRR